MRRLWGDTITVNVYTAKPQDGTSDYWMVVVDDGGWADTIVASGLTRFEAEELAQNQNVGYTERRPTGPCH